MNSRLLHTLFHSRPAVAVLLVASLVCVVGWWYRAVHRATDFIDFSGPYAQSHLWLSGAYPYDGARFPEFFPSDIEAITMPAYPPSTPVLVAPCAAFDWTHAKVAWKYTLIVAYVSVMLVLIRWGRMHKNIPQMLVFVCIGATFSPMFLGIGVGQISILATALIIGGLFAHVRERYKLAGVLIGLAVCTKPQLAGPVLLYCAVMPGWASLVSAVVTGAVVGLIGVAPILLHGNYTAWIGDWLHYASSMRGLDLTVDNPRREGRINLGVLLHVFIDNPSVVRAISISVVAVGMGAWVWVVRRLTVRDARHAMLVVTPLLVLLLLPMYHRFYDSVLMLVPFAWACTQLFNGRHVGVAVAMLVLALQFCFPWNFYLWTLVRQGQLPSGLIYTFGWHLAVTGLQTWSLLGILGLSMWTLARETQLAPAHEEAVPASA